jgi:hypothetical protein
MSSQGNIAGKIGNADLQSKFIVTLPDGQLAF